MRAGVNVVLVWITIALLQGVAHGAAAGEEETPPGADRWVPSLAAITGVTFSDQNGAQGSFLLDGESADPNAPQELRPPRFRGDRVVVPYFGGAVELMTPALRVAWFPRLFVTAEVLPHFASSRVLAVDGAPSRIRGPELNTVLAVQEDAQHYQTKGVGASEPRTQAFDESTANGQGMKEVAEVDQLAFGAKIGGAFAFQLRGRQLRLKPSIGWLHYKLGVKGLLVDPSCKPASTCTNVYVNNGDGTFSLRTAGFLREAILTGHGSGVFDAVGPGIELEMDTARTGAIGFSIFAGIHAYYIPGGRNITFTTARSFSDQLGNDTDLAIWETRISPWIYRGIVGVRFQWLGEGG